MVDVKNGNFKLTYPEGVGVTKEYGKNGYEIDPGIKQEVLQKLEAIVGPDYCTDSIDVIRAYSFGCFLGSSVQRPADFVVMPQSTEQVSQVVKLANEYKIPVTPKGWTSGSGFSGNLYGGMVVGLDYLDKILMIDDVNMKAVTDAGCSFFKLSQELFKHDMMLPTTEYSPGPNVAASAITPVNAFGKTRYGRNCDLVEGFEVVLPTGEIARVGSLAYEDSAFGPFFRYIHGPDLVGMFVMSNGAYGIVTKVAYACQKRPAYWENFSYYWEEQDIQEVTDVMVEMTNLEIFDIQINDRWKYATSEKPEDNNIPVDAYFILNFIVNAHTEGELKAKLEQIEQICLEKKGHVMGGEVSDTFFGDWPTYHTMTFSPLFVDQWDELYKTSKANYMYIYDSINFPTSRFPEVYSKLRELGKKYDIWGFPRLTVYDGFPMKSQTICSQQWAFINTRDSEWREKIYKTREEFREWFGALGGTHQQHYPPILPNYAWDNQKTDQLLAQKIKEALDPNDIMNPGALNYGRRTK